VRQPDMIFPYKIIDLTHTISSKIPTWQGDCGFSHELIVDYAACTTPVKFRVQKINMYAGLGTHMDAPAHCIPGGRTIDELDLNELISPCVVIDVSAQAHERYSVTPHDIEIFEQTHGKINDKSFVIIRTGWDQHWHSPDKYHNNHVFPSVSREAAELLLERQIVGLGIDTLSPDRPEDGYLVHEILLTADKYLVENVANSGKIPAIGSYTFALPLKIQEGTEAPIRLVALISGS